MIKLLSTFNPITKKTNATKRSDHRRIALLSHALQVSLNIIQVREYKTGDENICGTQYGFRRRIGTLNALFSKQVLIQGVHGVKTDVFACFIAYEKVFDRANQSKLMPVLH